MCFEQLVHRKLISHSFQFFAEADGSFAKENKTQVREAAFEGGTSGEEGIDAKEAARHQTGEEREIEISGDDPVEEHRQVMPPPEIHVDDEDRGVPPVDHQGVEDAVNDPAEDDELEEDADEDNARHDTAV